MEKQHGHLLQLHIYYKDDVVATAVKYIFVCKDIQAAADFFTDFEIVLQLNGT